MAARPRVLLGCSRRARSVPTLSESNSEWNRSADRRPTIRSEVNREEDIGGLSRAARARRLTGWLADDRPSRRRPSVTSPSRRSAAAAATAATRLPAATLWSAPRAAYRSSFLSVWVQLFSPTELTPHSGLRPPRASPRSQALGLTCRRRPSELGADQLR